MKDLKAKIKGKLGNVKIDKLKCRYCSVMTEGGIRGMVQHLLDVHPDKIDVERAKKLLAE